MIENKELNINSPKGNKQGINKNKRETILIPLYSPLIPLKRIKLKYIYINNLHGYVSPFGVHRLYMLILLSEWLCLLLNIQQIKSIKRAFECLNKHQESTGHKVPCFPLELEGIDGKIDSFDSLHLGNSFNHLVSKRIQI